jgi:hypothetical protein
MLYELASLPAGRKGYIDTSNVALTLPRSPNTYILHALTQPKQEAIEGTSWAGR